MIFSDGEAVGVSTQVYHLNLAAYQLEGATTAILPGDPARVPIVAQIKPFRDGRLIAHNREYHSWLGYLGDVPVIITSTGIGGPSTSIAVDELAKLGVDTFVRVGTTGAIQPYVVVGDVVITSGAVRLDGASTHYAPIEYPAVAHYEIVDALVSAAKELGIRHHVGITCSSDTFYPGQERYDSFSQYVPRRSQGITEEWRHLHVLNYEMEAATLLTVCSALGLRGGCVEGVVVNRTRREDITEQALALGEQNACAVVVAAVEKLTKTNT